MHRLREVACTTVHPLAPVSARPRVARECDKDPPPMSAAEDTARQDAWHSVETSFAALGRAVLILDAAYHVLQASYFLDTFVCEGTRDRLLGRSVSDLLGSRLFVPGDALHRALSQGHRAEGRRAFIKCPRTGAQLVSLSVAPLPGPDVRVLHDRARFIVVIRPADAPGLPNEMDDALLANIDRLNRQSPPDEPSLPGPDPSRIASS